MDLGLYDMDLSLFGGDLLVGLPPTSAELKVTQDAESTEVSIPWATSFGLDVSPGLHELADSSKLSTPVVDPPIETSWMDSRVDLLDLLAREGEHAFLNISAIKETPVPAADNDAVKILQDLAEETSQMLAAGEEVGSTCSEGTELQPSDVAQAAVDNLQSVVVTEDGPTSVDHLLDMLADGLDPGDLGQMNPGDLQPVIDSDILTSVSAEDVESILSSEPSSPVAHISNDSFSQLPPQQSNSLLAQYLLGSLDTTPASPDVSDMESLSSEIQNSDDDSDYLPASYRVSKTRSTPYARSKATKSESKTKSGPGKEVRILDKKLRKKQQNKDAATRYRQKKREEADVIDKECDELEERNGALKDKVEQMTREIGYLKNLLAEVYKARGLMKPKSGK